jgi:hypothetical protein
MDLGLPACSEVVDINLSTFRQIQAGISGSVGRTLHRFPASVIIVKRKQDPRQILGSQERQDFFVNFDGLSQKRFHWTPRQD